MNANPFFILSDQAVMIFHDLFENGVGRVAIVAPTFTPGVIHFGIAAAIGREWEFITGPSIVHTDRIWRKLLRLPTASPDHLIELVTGRVPA